MAGNPLLGEASFRYGGESYRLVLNNRVWIEAEEILGCSILDVVEDLRAALEAGRNPRLKHMMAIVYGGLIQHHPEVTQDQVLDMFMSGDVGFRQAVIEAMRGAQLPDIPDEDAGDEGNVPAPASKKRAGAGNGSSKHGATPGSGRKTSGRKRPAA